MQKSRRTILLIAFLCLLPQVENVAFAVTINRLNGGASVVYVDFSNPGPVVPLELTRTYNSITAVNESSGWNGTFGWGWTSPFETTLIVTPERRVLLRDGATGNTVTFAPEKEDPKARDTFIESVKRTYFERKIGRKVTPAEVAKMKLPDTMLSRLKTDPQFRIEMAMKYNLTGPIPKGELLISSEYGYQTIFFKDNQWIRDKDGIIQTFDREGRLVRQRDKNGYYFDYKYSTAQKFQVIEISAQDRIASLKFTWKQDRISEITDNKNRRAKYSYDAAGNLSQVTDSNGQTFAYKYENRKFPHLLTRIEYLSESSAAEKVFREVRYDDRGLATYHREKDGAVSEFTYGKRPNDPDNNFWTKSVRTPAGGTAEEQYDEYFIKARPDGTKYLYKQETKLAGNSTVTLFSMCCGKPTQINRNGEITNFKYSEAGLLTERVNSKEDIRLEYDPRWKKVTKVTQNGFVSTYEYDDKGNLVKANNSKQQKVALKYDKYGRISEMTDPEGKQIGFKYGDQGKPTVISEKGVGTIRIDYDRNGRIVRTESALPREKGRKPSEAKSQEVIRRVMKGFQHLLDIIRPAGVNLLTG